MKAIARSIGLLLLCTSLGYGAASGSSGASVSGTVKGPSGSPFRGAFVEAKEAKTNITFTVMSDSTGHYQIQNLRPGEYQVSARAVGYKGDSHSGVTLAEGKPASVDLALQPGMVRWSDLSLYQGKQLLPDAQAKKILTGTCFACHGFQSRMAAVKRSHEGWVQAVAYMRRVRHSRLDDRINNDDAALLVDYLDQAFGTDSQLPKSPAEMPGYAATVRSFPDESLKIQYVEYPMPGPNRMPFSATPDGRGHVWIADFGSGNHIGRLDPETGKIDEFTAPNPDTAGIHSVWPAPDGSVWLAQQAGNRLGRWDPKTEKITEWKDTYAPGKEGLEDGGQKHTVRLDHQGRAWATAVNGILTMFDPKTGEYTHVPNTKGPYGIEIDKAGNIWFAEFRDGGQLGRVDAKTGQLKKWDPPTPHSWPRRLAIDNNGYIWVGEFRGGKIARFDPKTETFKEFPLPGPSPTPYAVGIDKAGYIWYSSDDEDVIGRLDPKTGKVTEYPFDHPENTMKEFFRDAQGRMWYGTAPNNKVGYFIPPES